MQAPDDDNDEPPQKRFIHGTWEHIFAGSPAPKLARLCFDRENNVLVRLDIEEDWGWDQASEADRGDVEDSLLNTNSDAIDSPEDYGLKESDDLPAWASPPTSVGTPIESGQEAT